MAASLYVGITTEHVIGKLSFGCSRFFPFTHESLTFTGFAWSEAMGSDIHPANAPSLRGVSVWLKPIPLCYIPRLRGELRGNNRQGVDGYRSSNFSVVGEEKAVVIKQGAEVGSEPSETLNHSHAGGFPLTLAIGVASYIVITLIGLVVRVSTLRQYVGHIDEPASLLAIQRVAETGVPMLPSGVLYLQGAVFSYIAAPLGWIFSDTELWDASRSLYLVLALTIIPLSMKLASQISGSPWPAAIVGLLVACDPNIIVWSVTIRPYGLLGFEVIAMMMLFSMLLKDGSDARIPRLGKVVYWIPVLAVLGTFTHIGFWLVFPALALVGILVWRWDLLRSQRSIFLSGIVSLVPLIVFLLMGRFVGTGAGTGEGGVSDSFVGSHLLSVRGLVTSPSLDWRIWTGNFSEGMLHELMPVLIAFASGVLAFAVLSKTGDARDRWRLQITGAIVLVHWTVIFAVTLFVSTDPDPRYLHQVLAIGYVIVGLALWSFWRQAFSYRAFARVVMQAGIVLIFIVPLVYQIPSAASWRMNESGGSPDYWEATAWAAQNREDEQIVITALPPSAYFWFSEDEFDQLVFLAGPADGQRAQRYIKSNSNGDPGDYWLGVSSIGSTQQLCTVLTDHAGNALIVVDTGRLSAPWALKGQFETIIRGSTSTIYQGTNGVMVVDVTSSDQWTQEAKAECGQ